MARFWAALGRHSDSRREALWGEKSLKHAAESEKAAAYLTIADAQLALGLQTGDKATLLKARGHFADVLKWQPNHLIAGNNLAWMLAEKFNDPAAALRVAEQVRGNTPVKRLQKEFVDTLALIYRRLRRWEKARELLTEATTLYPRHAGLQFQMGLVYRNMGKLDDARNSLRKALQLGLSGENAKQARAELGAMAKQVSGK